MKNGVLMRICVLIHTYVNIIKRSVNMDTKILKLDIFIKISKTSKSRKYQLYFSY